jgi:hypothetical protein
VESGAPTKSDAATIRPAMRNWLRYLMSFSSEGDGRLRV